MTAPVTALPAKYRKARNIQQGYELQVVGPDDTWAWLPVKVALHITAPLKVSSFTLDNTGHEGWPDRASAHPESSVMSRRTSVKA